MAKPIPNIEGTPKLVGIRIKHKRKEKDMTQQVLINSIESFVDIYLKEIENLTSK